MYSSYWMAMHTCYLGNTCCSYLLQQWYYISFPQKVTVTNSGSFIIYQYIEYNIMVKVLMGYIQVAFLAHLHTPLLHTSTLLYLHTFSPHAHLHTSSSHANLHTSSPYAHLHTTSPHAHLHTTSPHAHLHTTSPYAHLHTTSPYAHLHTSPHAHSTPPLHMHTSTPADPLLSWLLLLWSSGATDTACGCGLCLL